jgi:drug/metabolite transporter (DMT)-like permease
MNIQPVAGLLLATLLLGEALTLAAGVGAALILAGVFVTTRRQTGDTERLHSRG